MIGLGFITMTATVTTTTTSSDQDYLLNRILILDLIIKSEIDKLFVVSESSSATMLGACTMCNIKFSITEMIPRRRHNAADNSFICAWCCRQKKHRKRSLSVKKRTVLGRIFKK